MENMTIFKVNNWAKLKSIIWPSWGSKKKANLAQLLTLKICVRFFLFSKKTNLAQLLTLQTPKLGPIIDFTAHIYIERERAKFARCESRGFENRRALKSGEVHQTLRFLTRNGPHMTFRLLEQPILAVRCALQKITFAMRCIFTAIYTLAAEIHCDVGHDASITTSAMPRCGELRERELKTWDCSSYGLDLPNPDRQTVSHGSTIVVQISLNSGFESTTQYWNLSIGTQRLFGFVLLGAGKSCKAKK